MTDERRKTKDASDAATEYAFRYHKSQERLALALEALEAVVAWFDAEDQHTGSFHDKMELCNYAEWMSRKALGQNVDEYKPVPQIILDFGGLHRGD